MVGNTSSMLNNREYLWYNYGSASSSNSSGEAELIKEQDRLLPIANVGRIMKKILPPNAKISKESKESMQECVTEFICFVTGEASDRCDKEKRKIVNAEDICWALGSLGFDNYVEALQRYMQRYRCSDDSGVVNKYVAGRDVPPSRKGFDEDNNSFPRRFALPDYTRNNTK